MGIIGQGINCSLTGNTSVFLSAYVSFMREMLYRNSKMEAFAAGADTGGARGAIFKQMAEMKKKIQLVEGERKAVFEDCEREKEENKEKIKKLELEIKQIKQEVKSALHKLL